MMSMPWVADGCHQMSLSPGVSFPTVPAVLHFSEDLSYSCKGSGTVCFQQCMESWDLLCHTCFNPHTNIKNWCFWICGVRMDPDSLHVSYKSWKAMHSLGQFGPALFQGTVCAAIKVLRGLRGPHIFVWGLNDYESILWLSINLGLPLAIVDQLSLSLPWAILSYSWSSYSGILSW